MTMQVISNEEINDVMKIVKYIEEFSLLMKGVGKTNEMKQENKKGFLYMLLVTLAVSLLRNMLACKGVIQVGEEQLELVKIFNAAWFFDLFWNTKILSKQT